MRLNNGKVTSSIQAYFQCQSPVNIYGFSLESDTGVFVDNLSFRGNSGMPLVKMPYEVLNGLDKYLGYESSDIDIALDKMMGKEFCVLLHDYLKTNNIPSGGYGIIPKNPE